MFAASGGAAKHAASRPCSAAPAPSPGSTAPPRPGTRRQPSPPPPHHPARCSAPPASGRPCAAWCALRQFKTCVGGSVGRRAERHMARSGHGRVGQPMRGRAAAWRLFSPAATLHRKAAALWQQHCGKWTRAGDWTGSSLTRLYIIPILRRIRIGVLISRSPRSFEEYG